MLDGDLGSQVNLSILSKIIIRRELILGVVVRVATFGLVEVVGGLVGVDLYSLCESLFWFN